MDVIDYLRFLLMLMVVIGLIIGLGWLLRRFGFGDGARGPLTRRRRLGTIESASLDARHKVILVRRDDVEHLVLVGPNTSQVIERGIAASGDMPASEPAQSRSFGNLFSRGN